MCKSGKKPGSEVGGVSLRHAEALGDGGLSEGYSTLTWLTDGKLIMERTEIKERREKRDAGVRYVGRIFFFYLHVNAVRVEKVMSLVTKHQVSCRPLFLIPQFPKQLYSCQLTGSEKSARNVYRNCSGAYAVVIKEHHDAHSNVPYMTQLTFHPDSANLFFRNPSMQCPKSHWQSFLFPLSPLNFHTISPSIKRA